MSSTKIAAAYRYLEVDSVVYNENIQNLQPSKVVVFMAKAKEMQARDPEPPICPAENRILIRPKESAMS